MQYCVQQIWSLEFLPSTLASTTRNANLKIIHFSCATTQNADQLKFNAFMTAVHKSVRNQIHIPTAHHAATVIFRSVQFAERRQFRSRSDWSPQKLVKAQLRSTPLNHPSMVMLYFRVIHLFFVVWLNYQFDSKCFDAIFSIFNIFVKIATKWRS